MQMRLIATVAVAVLLAGAPRVVAQEMPKPAPEMSQLAFMNGSWSCEGKMIETPMNPAGPATSTVEIETGLNGFWQTGQVKAAPAGMPAFEGHFATTYDPGRKQFVMLWIDSMGGRSESTSPGWKGDTMAYQGTAHMGAQTMGTRDTFKKNGDGSMGHGWEVQADGKWMPAGEETCRKK
jgi:Protein of unknown function (DUF1579)